ncbi:MAG: prepilin-type N-terminal cleavage/methylation domain-containing protein [Acidobacteria bacterium]|nr:prepilin-type N-terminal cleavage/methylation domain-containing protein [Acidobacteriota bacterium]
MIEKPRRSAGGGEARGYSLPELLIVIALIGIFVVFGGPALSEAFRSYKVRSAANNLTTDIRALRYIAVAERATRTMTVNKTDHATAPNQYSYVNSRGQTVTVRLEHVDIETGSDGTVSFNNKGATGTAGNLQVIVSTWIGGTRGDRYTITVRPSGTVASAYSTYTP